MSQRLHDAAGAPDLDFAVAPVRSPPRQVDPAWIDHNGHLNMAYYHVFFDKALDSFYARLGVGTDYLAARNASMFALEAHIGYLRELHVGDPVVVETQLLDHDSKRLHLFQSLVHADAGFVSATCESVNMHIDMTTRRPAPFPADIVARIDALAAAHAKLARPERAGRRVAIPR